MMAPEGSRAVFDSLLAKTHVQHALVQGDGRRNEVSAALATVFFLEGSPARLRATYDQLKGTLCPWEPSPRNIVDEETKNRFLGDARFQRAFMTYFSMENTRFAGNTRALSLSHIFTGDKPLLYGLLSGIGRPLALLSDGIELRNAILVMQALTLSAVDWSDPLCELLTHPHLSSPPSPAAAAPGAGGNSLPPEEILNRVAYDGRLSGVMKSGPGFHNLSHIFSNAAAKAAVSEYVRCLDVSDPAQVLQQIAALSVLLACATHKPNHPAFDAYLSRLPTVVNSARVVLEGWVVEDEAQRVVLVRGVWLVVLLAYITQLRPVVDGRLLVSGELAEEQRGWEGMLEEVRGQDASEGRFGDLGFLRVLRSLRELAKVYGVVHGRLYFHAAWKLVRQWQGWTGLGADREVMLNIRL